MKRYIIDMHTSHNSFHLTSEGFREMSRNYDPVSFSDQTKAKEKFEEITEQFLAEDGFSGFHVLNVYLTEMTIDGENSEAEFKTIQTKQIIVDTLEAA